MLYSFFFLFLASSFFLISSSSLAFSSSYLLTSYSFLHFFIYSSYSFLRSGSFSTFVSIILFNIGLFFSTCILTTNSCLLNDTAPTSMSSVFNKFDAHVYITVTPFFLHPSIEFSFVNCAHSYTANSGNSSYDLIGTAILK